MDSLIVVSSVTKTVDTLRTVPPVTVNDLLSKLINRLAVGFSLRGLTKNLVHTSLNRLIVITSSSEPVDTLLTVAPVTADNLFSNNVNRLAVRSLAKLLVNDCLDIIVISSKLLLTLLSVDIMCLF